MFVARLERGRERERERERGKGAGPATHLPPIQNNYDERRRRQRRRRSTQQARGERGERGRGERGAGHRRDAVLPACLPPAPCLPACLPGMPTTKWEAGRVSAATTTRPTNRQRRGGAPPACLACSETPGPCFKSAVRWQSFLKLKHLLLYEKINKCDFK